MKGTKSIILLDNDISKPDINALCVVTTEDGLYTARIGHIRNGKLIDYLWLYRNVPLQNYLLHIQEYKKRGFKIWKYEEF